MWDVKVQWRKGRAVKERGRGREREGERERGRERTSEKEREEHAQAMAVHRIQEIRVIMCGVPTINAQTISRERVGMIWC